MASAQDGGLDGAVLALAERAPGRREGAVHAASAAASPEPRAGERHLGRHPESGLLSEVMGVWSPPGESGILRLGVLNGTEPASGDAPKPAVGTTVALPRLDQSDPKCILWIPRLSHVGTGKGHLFSVTSGDTRRLRGPDAGARRWPWGHFICVGGGERGSRVEASLPSVST